MPRFSNHYLVLSALLICAFLFLPIVVLQIGSLGYEFYGPDVDDVYIYGGIITGKDRSWEGISFAWKFQLIVILIVLLLTLFSIIKNRNGRSYLASSIVSLILVLLFALWFEFYISIVVNNSDGADLSTHYHIGSIIYLIILLLQVMIVRSAIQRKRLLSGNSLQ
jgi:hypothetical protein